MVSRVRLVLFTQGRAGAERGRGVPAMSVNLVVRALEPVNRHVIQRAKWLDADLSGLLREATELAAILAASAKTARTGSKS